MDRLRIIFAASGEFALPTLAALREAGHDLVLVVSQPDRPAGRGRAVAHTPAAQAALELGLPLLRTADINSESLPQADLLVVIAFGQKIAPHVAAHARLGSVNLHASLLPRYRGAAPINWAICRGETTTGNSVIRLAQRMDAGAILAQSQVAIGELETAGELHDRLAADGAGLVVLVAAELAAGQHTESPQDESQASQAPRLQRVQTRLDWSEPAATLARRIRGMYPWPGCRVQLLDSSGGVVDRIILVRAQAARTEAAAPGVIGNTGAIATADGGVQVIELQPEGKRPMSFDAYRNGHRWEAGMRLESQV